MQKIDSIVLDEHGQTIVKVIWYGFKGATYKKVEEVVNGAHMLLRKLIENEKKLDETLKMRCLNIINGREKDLKGNTANEERNVR